MLSAQTKQLFGVFTPVCALAARPWTRTVQTRGANFQSASRQRATMSGTSCRRCWPARSASSAVSKYQPPSRAAYQALCCWQYSGPCSNVRYLGHSKHLCSLTYVPTAPPLATPIAEDSLFQNFQFVQPSDTWVARVFILVKMKVNWPWKVTEGHRQ